MILIDSSKIPIAEGPWPLCDPCPIGLHKEAIDILEKYCKADEKTIVNTLKYLGYTVYKAKKKEKLIPCKCGCKRREHWYTPDGIFLRCMKCGYESKVGLTEVEAKHNWNEAMKEETK